jgi:hypothetical protein
VSASHSTPSIEDSTISLNAFFSMLDKYFEGLPMGFVLTGVNKHEN